MHRFMITFSKGIILLISLSVIIIGTKDVEAFSGGTDGHAGITHNVLQNYTVSVNGKSLSFSKKAIQQIVDANNNVDYFTPFKIENHFDEESFSAAYTRIIDFKNNVINALINTSPNGSEARKNLGGALHTLQDFYSHSNWIFLHSFINHQLGRGGFSDPIAARPCPDNNYTLAGDGLRLLTSEYYFDANRPINKCAHGKPLLHEKGIALDFTNYQPYGAIYYPIAFQQAEDAARDFVDQIINDPRLAGKEKEIRILLDAKAMLGFVIDYTKSMYFVMPSIKSQVTQKVYAVKGTDNAPSEYLLELFADPNVGTPYITSDADAFIAAVNAIQVECCCNDCPELSMSGLLRAVEAADIGSTLYLITDASAKDEYLGPVVSGAAKTKDIKVRSVLNGTCSPVDPAYIDLANETGGQVFLSSATNIEKIVDLSSDLVNILKTSGSYDNLSTEFNVNIDSSLNKALFSVTHLFSDNDYYSFSGKAGDAITIDVDVHTKDVNHSSYSDLEPELTFYAPDSVTVLAHAYYQFPPSIYVTINYVLPSDGVYYLKVNDQHPGGNPGQLYNGGYSGQNLYYYLSLTSNGSTTLIDAGNELEPNNRASQTMSISYGEGIHGDMLLSVVDSIDVLRPSGIPVTQNDLGATITKLLNNTIISVVNPEPGDWKVRVNTLNGYSGEYQVDIMGNSPIQFDRFNFVERSGRGDSTAYFPIQGQPVIWPTQIADATLLGPYKSASFRLVTEHGDTINAIDLSQGDADASPDDFVGQVTLPSSAFRVAVSGIDQNNYAFDRLYPSLFHPQTIRIVPTVPITDLREGRTDTIPFEITNYGDTGRFTITFADNRGFIGYQATSLIIANGSTANVGATISVPLSLTRIADDVIFASIISSTDPNINNTASVTLSIEEYSCSGQPNGMPCTDHSACSENDVCSNGICVGTPKICDDLDKCTINTCDPEIGCVFLPKCDDNNVCTDDSCNPNSGSCKHDVNSLSCEYNYACTENNVCSNGVCVAGTTKLCNDNNVCTTDTCDPAVGCVFTPVPGIDDGNACTIDTCDPETGVITHSPRYCNDNNECTSDNCNPATGSCNFMPIVCNDNNICTDDGCNPATGCVYTPTICNDNNACTTDTCNTSTGCVYNSIPAIKIDRMTPVYYDTLQEAYDDAVTGETIQSRAVNFTGSLNVNRNITITLEGGKSCDYSSTAGATNLKGMITTNRGTLTIKNFLLTQ